MRSRKHQRTCVRWSCPSSYSCLPFLLPSARLSSVRINTIFHILLVFIPFFSYSALCRPLAHLELRCHGRPRFHRWYFLLDYDAVAGQARGGVQPTGRRRCHSRRSTPSTPSRYRGENMMTPLPFAMFLYFFMCTFLGSRVEEGGREKGGYPRSIHDV